MSELLTLAVPLSHSISKPTYHREYCRDNRFRRRSGRTSCAETIRHGLEDRGSRRYPGDQSTMIEKSMSSESSEWVAGQRAYDRYESVLPAEHGFVGW